jgi:hypothetical protein
MDTNPNNIGIGFWLAWVLASAIGFGAGAIAGIVILFAAQVPEGAAFPILFGIIFGAVGGFAQWLVLRRQIPESGLWIPFSTLGFMMAVATAASMGQRVSPNFNAFFILASVYGLLGGFLQGLILEKKRVPIVWWILASLLGGLLGCTINGSAVAALGNDPWNLGAAFFLILFRLGAPFGLGLGITTGGALIWFLRNPKTGLMDEAATQGTR